MARLSSLHRRGLLTLTLLQSGRYHADVSASATVGTFADAAEGGKRAAATAVKKARSVLLFGAGGGGARTTDAVAAGESAVCDAAAAASSSSAAGSCAAPSSSARSRRRRFAERVGLADRKEVEYEYEEEVVEVADDCLRRECPRCRGLCLVDAVGRGGHVHRAAAEAQAAAVPPGAPLGLPLNLWKVLFQACLTTLNVLCWLVPLKSESISDNRYALSLANAFSGGVFLSLAFGHLMPECVRGFEAAHSRGDVAEGGGIGGGGGAYNEALPYMLVLGGYLLIFFVEKVAFDAHGLMHAGGDEEGEDGHGHGHGQDGKSAKAEAREANGSSPRDGKSLSKSPSSDSSDSSSGGGRSAVILLGALAVHSVLEMTALGLAGTFGESALLSLSIALHQPAESIALLVSFLKSGLPKPLIIRYLSVFSAMGPCGVAIGMAVQEFASPLVDAAMLAVVAGTFVYVGATEVIPEEWEEQEGKWTKFWMLLGGIGSVFAITQYTMTLEA